MHSCEVMQFRAIGLDIIQFPIVRVSANQLPPALTNGCISLVFPNEKLFAVVLVAENWHKARALERQDINSVESFRIFGTCHLQASGHDVCQLPGLMAENTSIPNLIRPVHDQRRGDASLMHPMLITPKRSIRHISPGDTITLIGVFRPGHD
jgi:hypothetical protein